MSTTIDYLAEPAFSRLWAAARATWERNGGLRGDARVRELDEEEALAFDGLLPWLRRRPRAGADVKVSLDRLDERLRSSGLAPSLRDVLERFGGVLADRPAERAAAAATWESLWASAAQHPATSRAGVSDWLVAIRRSGSLKRAASGMEARTLTACLDAVAALPRDGVELSRFASELFGDPHALDYDTPLGGLVGSALAFIHDRERPANAAAWRAEWAASGVLCDSLSCNVLILGLRPEGAGPVSQSLRLLADAGEPALVTLRQLTREPLRFRALTVFACENPAVISAAAERFRADSRPVLCGGGWPNTAVATLLGQLQSSGCSVRYQGDFDDEGTRIARHLKRHHAVEGWRFDARTYLHAARRRSSVAGSTAPTDEATLAEARSACGVAVYEEDVLDMLLGDLGGDLPS